MEPRAVPAPPGLSHTEYHGCEAGATVSLHVVDDMGHQQARTDCTNIPSFVRHKVCFRGDLDFRRTQFEFFEDHAGP